MTIVAPRGPVGAPGSGPEQNSMAPEVREAHINSWNASLAVLDHTERYSPWILCTAIMSTTDAKTILSELNGLDLANPNSHREAIIKAQSLINTLQDPGDKAMENLFTVGCRLCLAAGGVQHRSLTGF